MSCKVECMVKELLIINVNLANRLFNAGVKLIETSRIIDGNKCFVFEIKPGNQAIVNRILNGK